MKLLIGLFAITAVLSTTVACNKDDENPPADPVVTFKADLTGGQEVPAPTPVSTATGSATLTFNTNTKVFTLTVTHTVATPTNGHIHKGAMGAISEGIIFPFSTFTSPINYTSAPLTHEQEDDLMANLYYVNIHSAAPYTGGEIRGQLLKQ